MKIYDKVKVIFDREEYHDIGIKKGMMGTIIQPEIRDERFYVVFIDKRYYDKLFQYTDENIENLEDDIFACIRVEDLQLVEDSLTSDETILSELPKNNPKWWCKVEDGFIINLLGEKKNKIPYKYDS